MSYRRLKLIWHASALLGSTALQTDRQINERNYCKSQIVTYRRLSKVNNFYFI